MTLTLFDLNKFDKKFPKFTFLVKKDVKGIVLDRENDKKTQTQYRIVKRFSMLRLWVQWLNVVDVMFYASASVVCWFPVKWPFLMNVFVDRHRFCYNNNSSKLWKTSSTQAMCFSSIIVHNQCVCLFAYASTVYSCAKTKRRLKQHGSWE